MIETGGAAPAEIARRLAAGERLVWWDRPIARVAARRDVNTTLLFGLVFFGFAIFWMTAAARAPGFFFLFGLPFVGVGLWFVSAPLRTYRAADKTLYALPDR
jgi:hypothetical protein